MFIGKRELLITVVLLFMLTVGIFAFKSLNNNRIPKSAKLVLNLKNIHHELGEK